MWPGSFLAKPGDPLLLMINARKRCPASPAFRDALNVGAASCLLAQSSPYCITRRDGQPIGFAGLWENAKEEHGTAF